MSVTDIIGGAVSWLWSGNFMEYVWAYMLPLALFLIIFGMANVFGGERMFGFVIVLGGLGLGFILGSWLVPILKLENNLGRVISPCICALFVAWIAGAVYKLAVCVAVAILSYSVLIPIFTNVFADNNLTAVAMTVFAALLCGIFAVFLMKFVLKVATSFLGGALIGCGVSLVCLNYDVLTANLILLDSLILLCTAVFGILGSILQFRRKKSGSESKEKKHTKKRPEGSGGLFHRKNTPDVPA